MDPFRRSTRYGTEDSGLELEPETARPRARINCAPDGVGLGLIGMGVAPVMFDLPFAFVEHHEIVVALHGPFPAAQLLSDQYCSSSHLHAAAAQPMMEAAPLAQDRRWFRPTVVRREFLIVRETSGL